ncbi:hypothetical protein [Bacillus sp. 1P06AnD]
MNRFSSKILAKWIAIPSSIRILSLTMIVILILILISANGISDLIKRLTR